jgi:hypothetical protein
VVEELQPVAVKASAVARTTSGSLYFMTILQ